MGAVVSTVFLAISLTACGSGDGRNVMIGAQTNISEVVIPLEWGRSTEHSSSVPFDNAVGIKVAEGLALPIDPTQVVFDNGLYTPDANKNATPVENEWASWNQWHGSFGETYEVRHLQATFTLPTGLGTVLDLVLFSPFYTDHGDVIPVNDNVYVYLNGTFIGKKGVSYGASKAPGEGVHFDFANETDGWYADGSFGSVAAAALQPGSNVIDIVAEEWYLWGGIGRLDLKLVVEFIGVPMDIKPQACPNPLNVKSQGVLPAAILGTEAFDVTQIDPASVRLERVASLHSSLEDVGTPFEPFIDKEDAFDCTDEGPDGFPDLTLKFDTQEIVATLGEVEDGETLILTLEGELFDSTSIVGEDVVLILKKGKK